MVEATDWTRPKSRLKRRFESSLSEGDIKIPKQKKTSPQSGRAFRPRFELSSHKVGVCCDPCMLLIHVVAGYQHGGIHYGLQEVPTQILRRDGKRQPSRKQFMLDAGLGRPGVTPALWLILPSAPRPFQLVPVRFYEQVSGHLVPAVRFKRAG